MLMRDSKRVPDSFAGHFRWRVQLRVRVLTTALTRNPGVAQRSYDSQSYPAAMGNVDRRTKTSTDRHSSTASSTGIRSP